MAHSPLIGPPAALWLAAACCALGLMLEAWTRGAPHNRAMMVYESLGVLVLGLALVRLPRRPPAEGGGLGRFAAAAMHRAPHAAMIALPVTGVLGRWPHGGRFATPSCPRPFRPAAGAPGARCMG